MKKIKAYTIMEMVVAMILAVIVTGVCFSGLSMIRYSFYQQQKKSGEITVFRLFSKAIYQDADRAACIMISDEPVLYFVLAGDENITYRFSDSLIVRSTDVRNDSFAIAASIKGFEKINDSMAAVKKLDFQAKISGEDVGLSLIKTYTSVELQSIYKKK